MYYAVENFYLLAVTAVKFSMLLLYLRLSPSNSFRTVVLGHMLLAISGGLIAIVATVLQCMPIAKTWNDRLPGTCFDQGIIYEAATVFNLSMNVMILILPVPTILSLQMPFRRKVLFLSVFSIEIMQVNLLLSLLS